MSVGTRLLIIGVVLGLGGMVYVGSLSNESRLRDERMGILRLQAQNAAMEARMTGELGELSGQPRISQFRPATASDSD